MTFLQEGGLQQARNRRDSLNIIHGAGWHFSYFGDINRIRNKVANFAHSNDTTAREFLSRADDEVMGDIQSGKDIYHRGGLKMPEWPSNDPRLPHYYLNNFDKFKSFRRF